MKKLILIAALAAFPVASMAAATVACTGGSPTAITGVTDGSKFVQVDLNPQCSANSIVEFDQSSTALWGGSGSAKGKNTFFGSTNGGSVKVHGACLASGCATTAVEAAVTAAAAITGS